MVLDMMRYIRGTFVAYKKHEEAYILMMAEKYTDLLSVQICDALIDYEVSHIKREEI